MDTAIYDAIQREIQKFTGDAAMNVEIRYEAFFYRSSAERKSHLDSMHPERLISADVIVKYDA